jgi:uncharacterized protein
MRFTLDRHPSAHLVTHVSAGEVRVGEVRITRSALLSANELVLDWPVRDPRELDLEALAPALALGPEVLIVGTGARICFPDASLFAELASRAIGLEVMDTAAACRTYNVLVNEDRPVVAALILP